MNEDNMNASGQKAESGRSSRLNDCLSIVRTMSSVLIFLILLITALIVVPKAVRLMNTAQRTIDNLESVSEELKALELAEAIKNIEDNTAQAMSDVSGAMDQVEKLDVDTLNQSIRDLGESVDNLKRLL